MYDDQKKGSQQKSCSCNTGDIGLGQSAGCVQTSEPGGFSLHAKMKVLRIFELTGTSASATLYLMLSPGWKCCLSQSCKKLKIHPQISP